jgi:hypothetical protein
MGSVKSRSQYGSGKKEDRGPGERARLTRRDGEKWGGQVEEECRNGIESYQKGQEKDIGGSYEE